MTTWQVEPGESLQGAINKAENNDIIVVSAGTYYENINFLGKNIIVQSADPESEETIRTTIIDGNGVGSVVTISNGEGNGAVLAGFTIRNGKSTVGGGIDIVGSDPTIRNNLIINNSADYGGGISIRHRADPIIKDNIISNNVALKNGGGIYILFYSDPTVSNNQIVKNEAQNNGGGIYIYEFSDPAIYGNDILSNTAKYGGGVFVILFSNPPIGENLIAKNVASHLEESDIYIGYQASPTIEKNV